MNVWVRVVLNVQSASLFLVLSHWKLFRLLTKIMLCWAFNCHLFWWVTDIIRPGNYLHGCTCIDAIHIHQICFRLWEALLNACTMNMCVRVILALLSYSLSQYCTRENVHCTVKKKFQCTWKSNIFGCSYDILFLLSNIDSTIYGNF